MLVTGVLWIAAAVLCAGGLAKLARPSNTGRALESVGLPSSPTSVRVLGLVEVVVSLAVLLEGGPEARVGLSVLYLGFAGFVAYSIRTQPSAPCGCFGSSAAPPTGFHLLFNLIAGTTSALSLVTERAPMALPQVSLPDGAVLAIVTGVASYLSIELIRGVTASVPPADEPVLFRSVG